MAKAKQTSEKKAPAKKAAETKVTDKKVQEKKVSEKKAVAKKSVEKSVPEKKAQAAVNVKKVVEKKVQGKAVSDKKDLKKHTKEIVGEGFAPYQEKKGEEYMSEGMREHFANILKKWRSELVEDMTRTVEHMQDDAANFPDPADRATQEEEFSLELRTRDRERKLIKKIDDTLQLIAENNYGWCDSCGVEIGVRRLEARPTATLCIDCKTLAEIKEKQTGL